MIGLSLTESQSLTALRAFLLAVLPAGVEVVRGQDNRTPEPAGSNFVTMTPILRERIETNTDSYLDAVFTGEIVGTQLTIDSVQRGALAVGSNLFGVSITPGTVITALDGGTGGVGNYTVNPSQNVSHGTIAAGVATSLQPTQVTVQLDVHGPASGDNAQIITTLFRDGYAVASFGDSGFDVAPLYAGDPRQMPYLNDQQQIEERWSIDAVMQCNPKVTFPQQFADAINVTVESVDAVFPPA